MHELRGTVARLLAGAFVLVAGCGETGAPQLFELLEPEATGVTFVNEVTEQPQFNILNYLNYYNGGGIAVGDVDNDGLPDLYFTSNLGSNRLYRNRGNYEFDDVTEQAGVGGAAGWTTGATMADVNGDGHTDIYVSSVNSLSMRGRNVLYLNNGDATFSDMTETYGLGHVGYSTQALFFDYDLDGDLDAYLLNHSTHRERGSVYSPQRDVYHPRAGDRLFRNDGDRFVDVTREARIYGGVEGYGLGVVASDLNSDGCPDLFVANDFQENDFLYYNNCDGTFTESIAASMGHTSRSSMGVDAADYNNDGRPDVVVLDMLPEREDILKTSDNNEGFDVEHLKLQAGYHPQYARNTLQLNRGLERFSEIGYLAGVFATDWSWAPLFADLDNDGDKDLFVTNGIYHRPNDLDFLTVVSNRSVQASLSDGIDEDDLALLELMPQVPIPNYAFRNNGDLTFTDMAGAWGVGQAGFSNGAAYVDLNNSGALDLVVNNINAPAAIYRNRARERTGHHYLKVTLSGGGANTAGIGSKVIVKHDGTTQLLEQMPTRGFQSSVDHRLHFGLGNAEQVDSLIVIWPDRRYQVVTGVAVDQTITFSQDDATGVYRYRHERLEPPLFENITAPIGIDYVHHENTFFDYNREPFMPHLLSTEGPALAVGDVDGDGLDDLFVGGAKWQSGRLFKQTSRGSFTTTSDHVFQADSLMEDVDAAFLDADGDGHVDLYVVSGGNEFWDEQDPLRDRLYLNDGRGNFRRATDRLPAFFANGCCVVPGDFNADGATDLFVGSRVVSREYGIAPESYLLENDGTGRFSDVTSERAPGLDSTGLVTSAVWLDYDHDDQLDLVVVGEWMPVRLYRQQEGRFVDRTIEAGLAASDGWWNTVTAADLTGDGYEELVLGNLGLNSYVTASRQEPARLYVHDFSQNGAVEQILTFYNNGVSYPIVGLNDLLRHIPQVQGEYPSYADFGASRIEDVFSDSQLREAHVLEAYQFASSLAVNNADGTFTLRELPIEAQLAPIYDLLVEDLDGDRQLDVLAGGNFYAVPPVQGRYDASYGLLLRGDGNGGLQSVDIEASNLVLEGQVRKMSVLRHASGDRWIVVARNSDRLQILLNRP